MSSKKLNEKDGILQEFGSLSEVRIGLSEEVRSKSVRALNRLLAHTMAIRDTYKKAHWQTSGATFYELHLLFDKHYEEQLAIMDALAERIQTLGGVTFALAQDIADESSIARAPRGRESAVAQLSRLLDAHEILLTESRPMAKIAAELGDDGTNDIIVSNLIRANELQSWFVSEHLAAQTKKAG
jgi:starvation-inducible DNA-binding protein